MGNHRFRLSDMMPNAWFYKLKDMGRTRSHDSSHSINKKQSKSSPQQTQPNQLHFSHPRDSYYFSTGDRFLNSPVNPKSSDTHFPDPPRKSSRRRIKRKSINSSPKLVSSTISAGCSCRTTLDSVWTKPVYYSENEDLQETNLPQFGSDLIAINGGSGSCSSSCSCRVSSSPTDIILDSVSELELPPILTKPVKFNDMITNMKKKDAIDAIEAAKFRRRSAKLKERNSHESLSVKVVKQESIKTLKEQKPCTPLRRTSTASPGLKLRSNSPRISSRKIQSYSRKSISSSTTNSRSRKKNVSESFAIVKSSFNPRKDFRDSMVEMIMENNIRAAKDLEELLACYLSLNSNEYHDLIVKVFEQIWFEITDIQL